MIGCQSDLKYLEVLSFFCIFSFSLLVSFAFFFSPATFRFVLLLETFEKEKYNTSVPFLALSWSRAAGFLLETLAPPEAQLAFLLLRNSTRD